MDEQVLTIVSQVLARTNELNDKFEGTVRASILEVADLRVKLAETNRTVEIGELRRDLDRHSQRLGTLEAWERESHATEKQLTGYWDTSKKIIIGLVIAGLSSGLTLLISGAVR